MVGVCFLHWPGIVEKYTACFGLCLAVHSSSEVNTQQPTWTPSSLKYLDQLSAVYRSAPLHLHKQDSTISTPPSPPLGKGYTLSIFPLQWLSSHTKPSTLVVLKRDWWGSPPLLTDFNESSLSESAGLGEGDGAAVGSQTDTMPLTSPCISLWTTAKLARWQLAGTLTGAVAFVDCCCSAVGWTEACLCRVMAHRSKEQGDISKTSRIWSKKNSAVTILVWPWRVVFSVSKFMGSYGSVRVFYSRSSELLLNWPCRSFSALQQPVFMHGQREWDVLRLLCVTVWFKASAGPEIT